MNVSERSAQSVPHWVLDLLLGTAVALVVAVVISADQGGRQDPDLVAYLFACGFGALMLARRRFPVLVLTLTMLLLFAYYALDYPAIGLAVPVAAALYSGAEQGHLRAAVVVSLLLVVVSTYFRLRDGQSLAFLLGYELISTAALMAAAIALGDSTRARRALRAEQEQTARLIEQEHAQRAERRVQEARLQVQEERLQIAGDLHDGLGHSLSVISLHADVAREALARSGVDEAGQALRQIRATSSDSMRELRAAVRLLKGSERPAQPAGVDHSRADLAHLNRLLAATRAGGLVIDVHVEGDLGRLPAQVSQAAYHILQEALTNVIRHAGAQQVELTLLVDGEQLHLRVADDGRAARRPTAAGNGIPGMQARAQALGGGLSARPGPQGGFTVEASLPMGGKS